MMINYSKLKFKRNQQKIYLAGIIFGFVLLIFSLFSVSIILSFSSFLVTLCYYIYLNQDHIRERGLVSYLPNCIQNLLLKRSLFDIICDIWYFQEISTYIKVLLRPFLYHITPEQAIQNLDELNPSVKKAVLTKGIVNIFPEKVKNVFIQDSSTLSQSQVSLKSLAEVSTAAECNSFLQTDEANIQQNNSEKRIKSVKSSKTKQNDNSINSKNMLVPFCKSITNSEKCEVSSSQDTSQKTNTSFAIKKFKKMTQNIKFPELPKTQVLYTNNSIQTKKEKYSLKWDRLESFKNSRATTNQQLNLANKFQPKKPLIGPLSVLNQLLDFAENGLTNKIDNKKILKLFTGSSILFLVQLIVSKRVRIWSANTLKLLMYIVTILISSGSLGVLLFKHLKDNQNKNKNNKIEDKSNVKNQ